MAACVRLENVRRFDRVVVMDQGRVAEDGAPEDLVQARGLFASMIGVGGSH